MKLDLQGEWILSAYDNGKSTDINNLSISIPGDNFSTLIKNNILPDPYYRDNEDKFQYLNEFDWEFKKTFDIKKYFFEEDEIYFVADIIDTVCKIFLNNKLILSDDNMFVGKKVKVKKFLNEGENEIKILISSPTKHAVSLSKNLEYEVPFSINSHPFIKNRNLIRKIQCHGGWDWGPCLMISGIYENIYLLSTSSSLEEFDIEIKKVGNDFLLQVNLSIETKKSKTLDLKYKLEDYFEEDFKINLKAGINHIKKEFKVKNPKLWYPNGYGEQKLYNFSLSFENQIKSKKIGFRTLKVTNKKDKHGLSLTFNVNGIDIFCKGANWIPMDGLNANFSNKRYRYLLESMKDCNMNMVRVWGGGLYEYDVFYDLCDELGILIWQDMMFACSLYPADEWFLDSVKKEIEFQIKRLKHHSSIALWCGNNENVGALDWYKLSKEDRDRYIVDYDRLYYGVIGNTIKNIDPSRAFWHSSPSAGPKDFSDTWHMQGYGDMHYWSVWHEGKSFSSYYDVVPRFCSEFGFQSFPSMKTISEFSKKEDWNANSPIMRKHQKNGRGNSIILETISRYFQIPSDFENFVYLSQVQQSMAMRVAIEFWRSKRPQCMGALYWQINDNWPVVSWSSIEYNGKWKYLQYQSKRFFANVQVISYASKEDDLNGDLYEYSKLKEEDKNKRDYFVYGLNDTLEDIFGNLITVLRDFDGNEISREQNKVVLKKESSTLISTNKITLDNNKYFLDYIFENDSIFIRDQLLFLSPKDCDFKDSRISFFKDGNEFVLQTDKPIFDVFLDTKKCVGNFSDNAFNLMPGEAKRLTFNSLDGLEVEVSDIFVKHLKMTY